MRQLVAVARRDLRWLEVEPPTIEVPGDALVRPVVVTLCDLDRPMITGAYPMPMPIPLGHEFVGEVVAIGDEVTSRSVGDLVVVPFQISCGDCDRCHRGLSGNCESVPPRSQYGFGASCGLWGCGFSDLVRVPYADHMLQPVPAGVDPTALAAGGDNLADGYRCVAPHLEHRPGARVLVLGGIGSVALYAAMFAHALGADVVDYVDPDARHRELAARLGADGHESLAADRRHWYDIVVDGTLRDPDGLRTACGAIREDGIIAGATMYVHDPLLPSLQLYLKGAHFHTGRVHARALGPQVIGLVADGVVDPTIVTNGEVLPFDSADETILDAGTKPIYVR